VNSVLEIDQIVYYRGVTKCFIMNIEDHKEKPYLVYFPINENRIYVSRDELSEKCKV
jgi:hypothetical protein